MDKLPQNNTPEELEAKVSRIYESARDARNVFLGYKFYIFLAKSDEGMRQMLKEQISERSLIPYMEYLKKSFSTTTKAEIDHYFPDFDSKMTHFAERLTADNVTKDEILGLYDDLDKYIKV